MDPHLISSIVTLLFIACFVAVLAEKVKQPYTIALVLTGLIVANLKIAPNLSISHDVTFSFILPPLLFYGAMHVDLERLIKNWKPIAFLAVPGVIVSTFFIGFLLHKVWNIELIHALFFGALITPTDPISVLSILKRVGAPKRLRLILEGESLFNDGTGVVIFSIILGIVSGHEHFELGHSILEFLKVAGGGTLVGLILGAVAYKTLKGINDHLHEVSITVALTFGTPFIAEHFHFSGIIAVVVAGIIMGNYGRFYSMSEKTRESMENFWEVIEFIINSLLFMVIGLELQIVKAGENPIAWAKIISGIIILLLARAIVVYPIVWFKNLISKNDLPWKWSHILYWGGLKGSISIALVVGLPHDFVHRELFLSAAFGIVLFSLVFQGISMKWLVKKLDLAN